MVSQKVWLWFSDGHRRATWHARVDLTCQRDKVSPHYLILAIHSLVVAGERHDREETTPTKFIHHVVSLQPVQFVFSLSIHHVYLYDGNCLLGKHVGSSGESRPTPLT